MENAISVRDLTKIFNKSVVAIDQVSFEVRPNEVFGLIGPNGSGKTTVQRILATILSKTSGQVFYGSREIQSEADKDWVRRRIGYVPQRDSLYGDLTVEEDLDIFSAPYKLEKRSKQENIDELLEKLEIADKCKALVKNLSGGLARRVSIAAALVHSPKIVFFDEVTMGLDPASRHCIWSLIGELKERAAIVVTTHYMEEAQSLCNRLAVLSRGRVLELASPEAIARKYKAANLNEALMQIIKREK